MAIGIYKITNKINGKVYIGQSKNITTRWEAHKNHARGSLKQSFITNAMRKYGVENFVKEVLEKCKIEDLDERERYWIKYYDSTNREKGYNQSEGGAHLMFGKVLTTEKVKEIKKLLADSEFTMLQIGEMYGVSEDAISLINNGKRWIEDIDYPIRKKKARGKMGSKKLVLTKEELIEELNTLGFNEVAAKYEVSLNTVKRRCDEHGIPNAQKKFNAWLDKYGQKLD